MVSMASNLCMEITFSNCPEMPFNDGIVAHCKGTFSKLSVTLYGV